jgi:MFS family permease
MPGRMSERGEDESQAKRRNLLFFAAFSFFTYPFAAVPLLFFFFQERGLSLQEYASLISIYYLAMVIFELPTGWLADRMGRRPAMIAGPLLLSAAFFTLWTGREFSTFAIGEILFGLGHALLSGPPSAFLYETLSEGKRADSYLRIESRMTAIRGGGTSLSFLAGGVVAHFHGSASALLLTACLCLGAMFAALGLREPEVQDRKPSQPADHTPLHKRLGLIYRNPAVLWLLFYYSLLFFLLRFAFHTQQPILKEWGKSDYLFLGFLYFLLSLSALPPTWFTAQLRRLIGERTLLFLLPTLISISLIGLSFGTHWSFALLFFVQQAPFGMHWPLVHAFANHRIPSQDRALVLSTLSFTGRIVFSLSFALLLTDKTELSNLFLEVGLVTFVLALLIQLFLPREKTST